MQIGMIGLGKMGANMTTRLVNGGHEVVTTDRKPEGSKLPPPAAPNGRNPWTSASRISTRRGRSG